MISEADFLAMVARYVADRLDVPRTKLATIDPAYTTGSPLVTFDGESTLSDKEYPYLASYTPAAGDRVLLVPSGKTYVIVGEVL